MKTTVRPPAPPQAETRADTHEHRRWPWVLGSFLALVALAAAIGGVWIASIEPLGPGSEIYGPNNVRISTPIPPPVVSSVDVDAFGVLGMVLQIPARPDMRFTYRVSIRNDGSLPITIVDIGAGVGTPISRRVVAFDPDRATTGGPFEAFHPFTLSPGEEAGIEIQVVVRSDACLSKRSYAAWSSEPFTYRVLGFPGFTRHSEVDTRTEIRLVGDGNTEC